MDAVVCMLLQLACAYLRGGSITSYSFYSSLRFAICDHSSLRQRDEALAQRNYLD